MSGTVSYTHLDVYKRQVLVCCFNLMGDALRDVLDPKEVEK